MKQKIEWYREVLDLEPGSRVFFPLAKLLAANGQTADAVSTLRQGILRHPDHVEARLLLVELLYLMDDDAGVQLEIANLGGTFALYPVFWKAWSEKLAETPALHDASLALRFFALALQGKAVNWADVITQGLNLILREAENAPLPQRQGPASLQEAAGLHDEAPADSPAQEASEDKAPDFASEGGEVEAPDPAFETQTPQQQPGDPLADAFTQDLSPDDLGDALGDGAVLAAQAEDASCEDIVAESDVMPEEDAAGTDLADDVSPDDFAFSESGDTGVDIDEASGEDAVVEPAPVDAPAFDESPVDTQKQPPVAAAEEDEAVSEEDEEAFSLRTRSMAEVLAEQGDIAGALDIYTELLTNATEEDRAGLEARAEDLSLRLHSPSPQDPKSEDKAPQPGAESTRLVNLLESLAQRLENRAR